MLIFLYDREGIDVYHTAKLCQRGDVIAVREDGWPWGNAERNDPMFAVVSVPDAAPEDLVSFLSHEQPLPGNEEDEFGDLTNTLQFRGFKVDVDAYAGPLPRGADVTMPLNDLLALKVQKDPIPDPAVLGGSDKIIG